MISTLLNRQYWSTSPLLMSFYKRGKGDAESVPVLSSNRRTQVVSVAVRFAEANGASYSCGNAEILVRRSQEHPRLGTGECKHCIRQGGRRNPRCSHCRSEFGDVCRRHDHCQQEHRSACQSLQRHCGWCRWCLPFSFDLKQGVI
jgi:hypothetical protein